VGAGQYEDEDAEEQKRKLVQVQNKKERESKRKEVIRKIFADQSAASEHILLAQDEGWLRVIN